MAICDLIDDADPDPGLRSGHELISFVKDRPGHDRGIEEHPGTGPRPNAFKAVCGARRVSISTTWIGRRTSAPARI